MCTGKLKSVKVLYICTGKRKSVKLFYICTGKPMSVKLLYICTGKLKSVKLFLYLFTFSQIFEKISEYTEMCKWILTCYCGHGLDLWVTFSDSCVTSTRHSSRHRCMTGYIGFWYSKNLVYLLLYIYTNPPWNVLNFLYVVTFIRLTEMLCSILWKTLHKSTYGTFRNINVVPEKAFFTPGFTLYKYIMAKQWHGTLSWTDQLPRHNW